MNHIESLSLKITAKGKRIFLNNKSLSERQFTCGARYDVDYGFEEVKVILNPVGTRVVADTFKGEIIDIQNKRMSESFPKNERVTVTYQDGLIILRAYHHDAKVAKREQALLDRVSNNLSLRMGGIFAGMGLLCRQIHRGLHNAGLKTKMRFANEYDRHAADVNINSCEIWNSATKDAVLVQDDIHTMDMSLVPELDVLVIGYPCVGFSLQQSVNRKRDIEHDIAGLLFVPVLEFINRANPAIIILENSYNMKGSTTEFIMDGILAKTAYNTAETALTGQEFGGFEKRKRLARVWYSKNLNPLIFDNLLGGIENARTVSDVLDPMSDNDSAWKDMSYIRCKTSETHHSHKFIEVKGTDTKLPAFSATYAKVQADSPIVGHPTNPELHRIFTPSEHCNVRSIDGDMKAAIVSIGDSTNHLQNGRTNVTKAHSLLGNAISPEPWEAFGKHLGQWIVGHAKKQSRKLATVSVQACLFGLAS